MWLESKRYCETFGEKSLTDRDRLKLMEMSDNHVEYHTVKEFVSFCVEGPGKGAAGNMWSSSFPGTTRQGAVKEDWLGWGVSEAIWDRVLMLVTYSGLTQAFRFSFLKRSFMCIAFDMYFVVFFVSISFFSFLFISFSFFKFSSSLSGQYFAGGRAKGGMVVDQRLLPRIVEVTIGAFLL